MNSLTVGNFLSAHNSALNNDLWTCELASSLSRWPIFVNDTMFVKAQQIYALDTATGKIIWQTHANLELGNSSQKYLEIDPEYIVSNIAVGDNIVYAINFNDSIIGYHAETGEKVGTIDATRIQITPAMLEAQSVGSGYRLIAASDKYVAAYYGDSQELIVFERTDGTP